MRIHPVLKGLLLGAAFGILAVSQARADVYGRIRGTVTDPSGAVVPGVTLTVTNVATGVRQAMKTSTAGTYEALNLLAPATYSITTEASGFKKFEASNIPLALNQIYVLNIQLELGTTTQEVTVEATGAQVESTSIELGTTINSRAIVDLPLNGRNWVQLQQLQPGVVAASDARGVGDLVFATNGSQPDQNSYLINGTDNNDFPLNTPQTTPSADAIAEFKMVTNTINPEYGRNSGAILNAVIKSGNNQFHGDGFDFYRDTSLNARNFFLPTPATVHRNQFGGTIGGPIWKNHTFFFFSYQGTRQARPENSGDCGCGSPGVTPVFSSSQLTGLFPDVASSSTLSPFPLVGESGATYPAGTAYSTIFPTGHIQLKDFNSVAAGLLKYVKPPNSGTDYAFDAAFDQYDDQYLNRIDHTFSSKDALWVYWLWEREGDTAVLPFIGATMPGFGQKDGEHWQQYVAAWNHTFSSSMLNEARVGYTRLNYLSVVPQTPTAPSSAGFTNITPQLATGEGVPFIDVVGYFDLGFSEAGPQPRLDQTYDVADNLTKITGRHSFKLGFDMRRFEVYNPYSHINSGTFTFNGTGPYSTGDPGADFLLGIPYQYEQGSGDILNERTQEYYSYFQDQWKVKPNLALTYGVGWSIDTPQVDNYHDDHAGIAFRPGQQSTVFPTSPVGYVFQGDAGVNAFGTTHYTHFGPRLGFAYSPDWGPLTGGAGKTSIRAGWGVYFDRFLGEVGLQTQGSPPFAISSYGIADAGGSPSFANPWADVAGNVPTIANKFPYEPSSTPNFSNFEPFSVSVYDPKIGLPTAQNFNLTIQRQLSDSTIFSIGYVGAIGRHELLTSEINPGINPAGCAANPECVAYDDLPTVFPGNYKYPGNIFGSVGQVETVGISSYNSIQTSMERHFSHGLQLLLAYVYSKSMDDSSGFENSGFQGGGFGGFGETRSVNPFNRHVADYGPSIFDAHQRLVISYVYSLPSVRHFNSLQKLPSRLTDGWQITGITTLQSGFPLDVVDGALQSLTVSPYDFYDGPPSFSGWDVPNRVGKTAYVNPRHAVGGTNYWFFPQESGFGAPALGTEGNASRNLLRGPGLNNFDFALMKDVKITESVRIEMRFEFFNFFNHTQFDPNGITTDFNSPAFGTETAAHDPRLIQLAGKIYF